MAPRYAVNGSIMFQELPLLQRPAAIAAAGFSAAEFWWPWPVAVPSDREVDEFVRAVEDAGIRLVGLNFFAGDMPGGDRGLVSWPARSAELRDNLAVTTGIGERLGCKAFNALYGNRIDGVAPEEQDDLALENLALCADEARRVCAVVLLEAVSGAPAYPLKTADDVFRVLDRLDDPGVGFLCDLYHLVTNGDDVDAVIARYGARVAHVQVADAPGRGEPGTGELDLARWLGELEAKGYSGYTALEYKPTTAATEDSLAWLPRELRAG